MSEFTGGDTTPSMARISFVGGGLVELAAAEDVRTELLQYFAAIQGLSVTVELSGYSANTPNYSLEDETFVAWLDQGFGTNADEAGMTVRAHNGLARGRLDNYRAVLLYGKDRLRDIRNLGGKGVASIEARINDNPFGITLQSKPDLPYAASICESTDQLPASYVDTGALPSLPFDYSVASVIAMSTEEIVATFVKRRITTRRDSVTGHLVDDPYTVDELQLFRLEAEALHSAAQACSDEYARLKQLA